MCQNVCTHIWWRFHYLRTKWTSPLPISKSDGFILKKDWLLIVKLNKSWSCIYYLISIFLNYECSFLRCLSRLSLRLQAKSQKWHWNGLSPVCVSIWILIWAGFFIIMEQNGHAHEPVAILIGSFWKKNDFNENKG